MRDRKGYYYLILAISIFALFIFVSLFIFAFKKPLETEPTSLQQDVSQITSTPKLAPLDIAQKNSDKISLQDFNTREKLISNASNGYIFNSETYHIVYLKDENIFQVRLLTSDIETAKLNAVNWFLSQGISRNGICTLPVVFYVPPRLIEKLRTEGKEFNPLPEGC